MKVRIAASALVLLLRLFAQAMVRGIEMHAYVVGRRTTDGARIEHFVSAGTTIASAGMVRPDYGRSGVALAPYLARGLVVVGEIHSHRDSPGPSAGDVRTMRDINDTYPGYACLVIAPGKKQPVITAHSIAEGVLVEHEVIMEEYQLLDGAQVRNIKLLILGNGSGIAAATPSLLKFGFDTITIADEDVFEARNVERHLAPLSAAGQPKVAFFKEFARERTTSKIRTLQLALRDKTRHLFNEEVRRHDVIFNGTGHPVASRTLASLARRHKKTVIHAGVFPRGSGGFVFLDTPEGACYSCLFDLHLQANADDEQTMRTLTKQYGLTEEQLAAQLGLWADVGVVASLHVKVLLEYLKGNVTHNLYLVDNNDVALQREHVAQREDCICKGASS